MKAGAPFNKVHPRIYFFTGLLPEVTPVTAMVI